jgi:hypothetical protein
VILHSVDTTQQRKLRGAELEGTAETPNEIKLIDVVGSSFFELFGGTPVTAVSAAPQVRLRPV